MSVIEAQRDTVILFICKHCHGLYLGGDSVRGTNEGIDFASILAGSLPGRRNGPGNSPATIMLCVCIMSILLRCFCIVCTICTILQDPAGENKCVK